MLGIPQVLQDQIGVLTKLGCRAASAGLAFTELDRISGNGNRALIRMCKWIELFLGASAQIREEYIGLLN